jgi:phenylacetate-CoA ligase
MKSYQYWQKELETLPREQLLALQEHRLRHMMKYVWDRSAFYRHKFMESGIHWQDIQGLEDLSQLPLTTKSELRQNQIRCVEQGKAPYADVLCVPEEDVSVIISTAGTTGVPILMPFTAEDRYNTSLAFGNSALRGLYSVGGGKGDILIYLYNMGGAIVGGGAGFITVGGCPPNSPIPVIPGHIGKSKLILETMRTLGVTILYATPSFVLYLAELATKSGLDPRKDFKVRKIRVGGEPGPIAVPEMRTKIEKAWGAECYDGWGQAETQTRAIECVEKCGGHAMEDMSVFEVIDPETKKPLPLGEMGVLVVTSLTGNGSPLIRFDVNDLVRFNYETCACGRTSARMTLIRGRTDDMLKVRSVRFYPEEVQKTVQAIPGGTGRYLVIVDKDPAGRDTFTVKVEHQSEVADLEAFRKRVEVEIRNGIGLSPVVELVLEGGLGRSAIKTTTILDFRKPGAREAYEEKVKLSKAY